MLAIKDKYHADRNISSGKDSLEEFPTHLYSLGATYKVASGFSSLHKKGKLLIP